MELGSATQKVHLRISDVLAGENVEGSADALTQGLYAGQSWWGSYDQLQSEKDAAANPRANLSQLNAWFHISPQKDSAASMATTMME